MIEYGLYTYDYQPLIKRSVTCASLNSVVKLIFRRKRFQILCTQTMVHIWDVKGRLLANNLKIVGASYGGKECFRTKNLF